MDQPAHDVDALLAHLDWREQEAQLNDEGFALLPALLRPQQAAAISALAASPARLRTTRLEDMDLGRGTVHAFGEPLPPLLTQIHLGLYRHLAPIANRWNELQGIAHRFPEKPEDRMHAPQQSGTRPASHLTRLLRGDFVALHHCARGGTDAAVAPSAAAAASPDAQPTFPLHVVALLSRPGVDFEGGEFVMTEQRPRLQSRPSVVPLQLGDAAIVCAGQRPVEGIRGIYRVTMRQAISRVRRGERVGLELSFQAYAPMER